MTMELAALPPPQVLEDLDFEEVYQEKLEAFRLSMGDNWSAELESDPVLKLIEQAAYGALQNRARVNDAGKALLLAHAERADLDHLAANVNLQRLVIQAGDPSMVPPTPQVLEEDDALRERVQLSYEGLTTAGPRNSYILHARNASGLVADATAESPSPAVVVVTVLSLEGSGAASPELLEEVRLHLNDEDVRPVADRLTVQSAVVIDYHIEAVLYPQAPGPENEAYLAESQKRLSEWINPRRRLGLEVARSGIDAQLHVPGIARVELLDWTDVRPSKAEAAYCTSYNVVLGDSLT
ncbi:baseplate J/gp47 family protein [Pseudomonas sp. IT-P291]|uniref:baseplate assembly protein n=1 Tax=Pseudomonas sp. IT-P291 TaxID=3026448 RepID=UPI0039E10A99